MHCASHLSCNLGRIVFCDSGALGKTRAGKGLGKGVRLDGSNERFFAIGPSADLATGCALIMSCPESSIRVERVER